MQAMFFLFSNGNVLDLLLQCQFPSMGKITTLGRQYYPLDEVEYRHPIPDRREHRISIRCENDRTLTVDRTA